MENPNAPRPPWIPELLRLPNPELDKELPLRPLFVADPDLAQWVDDHFLNAESDLLIVDHADIANARIGYVWTNVPLSKSGKMVPGQAQLGEPGQRVGDAWARGAIIHQRREWFGWDPELLVYLYAPWFARADAVAVAAVIDHELRHFGIKFKDGEMVLDPATERPVWGTIGHDLEEFRGTIEYFGSDFDTLRSAMKAAMAERPYFDRATVERHIGPSLFPR